MTEELQREWNFYIEQDNETLSEPAPEDSIFWFEECTVGTKVCQFNIRLERPIFSRGQEEALLKFLVEDPATRIISMPDGEHRLIALKGLRFTKRERQTVFIVYTVNTRANCLYQPFSLLRWPSKRMASSLTGVDYSQAKLNRDPRYREMPKLLNPPTIKGFYTEAPVS